MTTPSLPTTVWLPAPGDPDAVPGVGLVLPDWAIEKIRTEFTARPGRRPLPLLRFSITDTAPGMDARTPCVTYGALDGPSCATALLLAELHPDTLPTQLPVPACGEMPGAMENGWPGFFHRAHRLLPVDGLLLLATRQHRDDGILVDPLGALVACARTAGFRYLQHIVVAHAHPAGDRLVPVSLADAGTGVTHSDLIVLSAIHHA
ncbi:hypothetical protein POF50_030970 [Streptomyces sp. SL13]|uniref:Uncharacterized protein n=1 Tax=Streptantibioticus silvisoli TaxID=2705255 RepID=A0AA90H9H5_9ACTN|nr:hypothetical protein [Streptantibioticus silvisoli]MDI5973711.1 hypothetical protein [Streptantibioticus silvisoli]